MPRVTTPTSAGDSHGGPTRDRCEAGLSAALRALAVLAVETGECADAYLVGGAVRDALLGRSVVEADVVVPGDARGCADALARAVGGSAHAIGTQYDLHRVALDGGATVDVLPMRGGDLGDDLAARDFTVNALAIALRELPEGGLADLQRQSVVDLHGGLADLDARSLRLVGPDALDDDPLRALRAVRIACELDFEIQPATAERLPTAAKGLEGVAAERVGAELWRLFGTSRASRGGRLLEEAGLLTACFPALEAGRGVEQRPSHLHPVLEHQLVALEWLDALLAEGPPADRAEREAWEALWRGPQLQTRWGDLRQHLKEHVAALRLATLLHDVGKPATRSVEPDGRTRFFGHDEVGAQLTTEMLRALRLPEAVVERVALLVRQHLRPGQVAAPGLPPTARALHRFHSALGDATPDVCVLFLADSLATAGAEALLPRWPAYVALVRGIAGWEPPPAATRLRRLVDGHAVMRATGLAPGPAVGRVLEVIEEAAAAGELRHEAEAIRLAVEAAARERDAASP
jgi:poly(A) polymerase/tRNA nucleotidyltransferase (CCA-adding enzyme)